MRKVMITTVSTIALAFAGAGIAAAQGVNTAPPQSITPGSPAAGAIKKNDTMRHDPALPRGQMTTPPAGGAMDRSRDADRSSAADTSDLKSFTADKSAAAQATLPGGLSAAKMIGADVRGPSGDNIGEVKDLAVGPDNKVKKAIVQVGGFLGMGAKNVAVDIAELKPQGRKKGFSVAMTEQELKSLPHYKQESGHWVRDYKGG